MTSQETAGVIRKLISAHEKHDVATLREILDPALAWHSAGSPTPLSRDDYLRGVEIGHAAFPDMTIEIADLLSEGDRVAARLVLRGRHAGPFLDIPPRGRSFSFMSCWFYRLSGGRVAEAWHVDEDFVKQLRS